MKWIFEWYVYVEVNGWILFEFPFMFASKQGPFETLDFVTLYQNDFRCQAAFDTYLHSQIKALFRLCSQAENSVGRS